MRPQPIFLERVSYRDALQNESFLSIGAELQVSEPRLAATMLKDQINGSLPIVRDALRSVACTVIADGSPEFRSKTANDLTLAANADLGRVGMKLSDVEIVEFWSRHGQERIPSVSN